MLKFRFPLLILLLSLIASCGKAPQSHGLLNKDDIQRVVFLGGSLISSMEEHPFLEVALTKQFQGSNPTFRNIGWSGDDVFGMARSQFGSAQNTRSWSPPTAEKGFGSEVLKNHVKEANPSTLFIGYGNEVAYIDSEEDFLLFESGYKRLLDFVDSLDTKVVLLGTTKLEKSGSSNDLALRINSLEKANTFIRNEANNRNLLFIDLYDTMFDNTRNETLTYDGFQLNEKGHQRMSEVILNALEIESVETFIVSLDEEGKIESCENCTYTSWDSTVNGVRITLKPSKGIYKGLLKSNSEINVLIDGEQQSETIVLSLDAQRHKRLVNTIQRKNRFYRNRLRPLNEAYIYLFRQHEMGHLAYEMDDLLALVSEKEHEIYSLIDSYSYDMEIELLMPYSPPKSYADDEIPAFIPKPDIIAELAAFRVAEGFEMSLFASDPMIANPININWDNRGRAWVATSSTYPHIVPGKEPNDQIVILEDSNGDGVADKHIVFAENLLVPHAVMPVKGGAFVTSTTQLLFLADTDGDDIADERHVVFDGFGNADVHHTIHGLRWTPWGDLHFTQGIYINSFIETKDGVKRLNGSGIWSYRPDNNELKVYSRGLVNPWGEAIDKWGQTFATDGAGSSGINYVFPESAHMTAVGASTVLSGLNEGTPKYTAADMVYNSHFPSEWQGDVITNDFRANRTVRYQLEPNLSSYTSTEEETLLYSEHRSYRPVDSKFGPDGALYVVDWYNPIIDHGEVDFYHPKRDKSHGRIWKLKRKGVDLLPVQDMTELDDTALLELLGIDEQLTRLQANRELVERKIQPEEVLDWLSKKRNNSAGFSHLRVEVLWLFTALNHYDENLLIQGLRSANYRERAAATRLISKTDIAEAVRNTELKRLIGDPHPQVRLEALHCLREVGTLESIKIAIDVMNHERDENIDFALSLFLEKTDDMWLEEFESDQELFGGNDENQMFALLTSDNKKSLPYIYKLLQGKRLPSDQLSNGWEHLAKIGDALHKGKVLAKAFADSNVELLQAMNRGTRNKDEIPEDLSILEKLVESDSIKIKKEALKLAGLWQVDKLSDNISTIISQSEDIAILQEANRALSKLGRFGDVKTTALNGENLKRRSVATSVWIENEPENAVANAVELIKMLEDEELLEMIFIAFRRTENGPEVLHAALEGKEIPENAASVGLRVIQNTGLNLADLEAVIRNAGSIKSIGLEMSDSEKESLCSEAEENGDVYRGNKIYRMSELMCGSCHIVDKEGGLSGPFLGKIGTFMTPRSILESVINPNAVIKQNYETVVITKNNGEVVSGILSRKKANSSLLRQANGNILEITNDEIEKTDVSSQSLMPTGLTRNLHKDELRDLLAYLMSLGVEEQ